MNKYNVKDKTSYCLGMSLTIEALKHCPDRLKEVYLSTKANRNEQLDYLLELCDKNNIEIIYDETVFDKLSIKENCYAIGIFNKFYNTLKTDRHIVLYKFNDYGELGTIMRSAVSFDFKDIVLVDSDIDYFDPRCIRASMGAIFHLNIISCKTLDEYIDLYPKQEILPFIKGGYRDLNSFSKKDHYSLLIPQRYDGLNSLYDDGYSVEHNAEYEISLSALSSIVFNFCYHQNAVDKNISCRAQD